MQQLSAPGFPQFAPLSTPIVKHWLSNQSTMLDYHFSDASNFQESVEHISQQLQQKWSLFEQYVHEKRLHTYALMNAIVQFDQVSSDHYVPARWFRETLSAYTPHLQKGKKREAMTPQTLSVWSERHILRHHAWGQLDAQCVAGIITARQLDQTRERSWLPSMVEEAEPLWWCYSQSPPLNGQPSPIVPCPVPIPQDLPPATLLWTPWIGAAWDPHWLQIGTYGSVRWAGAKLDQYQRVQWQVTEADLQQWDPEVAALDMGFLKNSQEMLNGAAHFVLLRLALSYFHASTPMLQHSEYHLQEITLDKAVSRY